MSLKGDVDYCKNHKFSINNCSVKASKIYENLMNLPLELLRIPTVVSFFERLLIK